MKNIIQKITKRTRKSLLPLLVSAMIGMSGCSEKEFEGKILNESFYPSMGGGQEDRYTALIKTPEGDKIISEYLGSAAREIDLKYNKGDEIIVKCKNILGFKVYKIMRNK